MLAFLRDSEKCKCWLCSNESFQGGEGSRGLRIVKALRRVSKKGVVRACQEAGGFYRRTHGDRMKPDGLCLAQNPAGCLKDFASCGWPTCDGLVAVLVGSRVW